jgi:xylulokinase
VAVGGGTQGELWTQIVSDVTGQPQLIPSQTIGASYGAAYLAAGTVAEVRISEWNPPARTVHPNPAVSADYEELYDLYLRLYPATQDIAHALAGREERLSPQNLERETTP